MGLTQLNFEGKTKVDVAIMRIREFELPEGYYLAFGGGKDSITIYDLTLKAGVKFDAHYAATGIDPPELVQFIKRNYPDVERQKPVISMWRLIEEKGLPTRTHRFCCEALKEVHGDGRRIITGIRWAESPRRKNAEWSKAARKTKQSNI